MKVKSLAPYSVLLLLVWIGACDSGSSTDTVATEVEAEAAAVEVTAEPDSFGEAVNAAMSASETTQSATSREDWKQFTERWQEAIALMLAVPESSENYQTAQAKAGEYEPNLAYAKQNAGLTPQPYRVVDSGRNTVLGRKRIEVRIVAPEAETFEQRGETVILAARELQAAENAQVVMVVLEASEALAGEGYVKALARYAPDGGGFSGDQGWTWQVTSSPLPLDPQQVEIAEAWSSRRDNFQISDGFGGTTTDEDALSAEIAADFGLSPDEVRLFYLFPEDYPSPE